MAWTVAILDKPVEGAKRCHVLSMTADAAEQAVDTGLSRIDYFLLGPKSMATGAPHIYANVGSTGTALNGYLGCSGFVSGDVLFAKVYGV